MASASYYKDLMHSYSKSKKSYLDRKDAYDAALEKIKKLNSNLSDASENLKLCEKNFLGGGYVDQGAPLYGVSLKKYYTQVENLVIDLKRIMDNTEVKIKDYSEKITYYRNLYDDATKNYERAKKEEMK